MAIAPFIIDETIPGDSDIVSQHPANARTFRDVVEDYINTDHDFNTGHHSAVGLIEVADPTFAANTGFIYVKDVAGATELFYMDHAGTTFQLTSGGGVLLPSGVALVSPSNTGTPIFDDFISHTGDTTTAFRFVGVGNSRVQVSGSNVADFIASGVQLGGTGARVSQVLAQDTMSSDSATSLATQQSIKAYVDATAPTVKPTLGTLWTSTSGTSNTWTGIPANTKQITLSMYDVSTNGAADYIIQVGPVGGIVTTGYRSHTSTHPNGGGGDDTDGAHFDPISPATTMHGSIVFTLIDAAAHKWAFQGQMHTDTSNMDTCAGAIDLAGALERIKVGSTDTFDSGVVNILYQG